MPRMNRLLFMTAAIAAGLATPSLAASDQTLMVAEPVHSLGYLPLYVADQKGFFSELGLKLKIVTIESGSGHTNAVLSGQAFAFIGGPEHDAFAAAKGEQLRSVVNVVDRGNVYYMAPKGKRPPPGMSMAKYFKGKRIGVSFYGGTPNSITRFLLKKWKLDPQKDVTLVETTPGAIFAAMKLSKIDIAVSQEPQITQGVRAGLWGKPFYNIPKKMGPYAYSTINVRLASIKKDPDTVRKFVEAVSQGLKFTYDHRKQAALVAKKEFPTMSAADLKATMDRSFKDKIWSKTGFISRRSWATAQNVVRSAGILKKHVPYDDIIDMQFMTQLVKGKKASPASSAANHAAQ